MSDNVKMILAVLAFISAVVIGFIALFLPPPGVIDSSVLWFTSQLLVFVATMLGLNLTLGKASTERKKGEN